MDVNGTPLIPPRIEEVSLEVPETPEHLTGSVSRRGKTVNVFGKKRKRECNPLQMVGTKEKRSKTTHILFLVTNLTLLWIYIS